MSSKKNYIYNLSYTLINMLLPLVTAPYLSRILGVEGIGKYSFNYAITFYFMILAKMGLINYGTRQISFVRDNRVKLNKTFSSIYYSQLCISLIVFFSYIIYIFIFSKDFLVSLTFSIMVFASIFDIDWLYSGLEKFKSISLKNIFIKLVTVVCIFIFVKEKDDLIIYVFIMSIGTLLGFMIMWINLKKVVSFSKVSISDICQHIIPNVKLTVPVIAVNIYRSVDKIMLGFMTNNYECGLYENAEKIIYCLCGFISSYGTVMLPKMSNLAQNGEFNKIQNEIRKSMFFLMGIIAPFILSVNLLSNEIVLFLFGKEFLDAQILLITLSVTIYFIAWTNIIRTHLILPLKKDNIYIISVIVGAVIDIGINMIFIPKYGAFGAVIGTIFAEFSAPLVQTIFIRKNVNSFELLKVCCPSFVITIITYFIISLLRSMIIISNIFLELVLWGCVIFSIYIFLFTLYLFIFKRNLLIYYFKKIGQYLGIRN